MKEYGVISPSVKARKIGAINIIGLNTLVRREVGRFIKVYSQTIVAPVVTTFLFYTVFALALDGQNRVIGDVPFLQFLAPGLIMMTMAQNAFSNTSSSLIIAKVQGNIVDVLMPPLSVLELFLGFVIGGLARGLCVGLASLIVIVPFLDLSIHSYGALIIFALLGNCLMATMGLMAGIWAEKFDHIAAFTNFFVTPLTFLSGTFYTLDSLPPFWQDLAHINPFFYMIDGFRYAFIGQADGPLWIGAGVLLFVNLALMVVTFVMISKGYKIKS
jgi:ABC-2 type transport system permease protein